MRGALSLVVACVSLGCAETPAVPPQAPATPKAAAPPAASKYRRVEARALGVSFEVPAGAFVNERGESDGERERLFVEVALTEGGETCLAVMRERSLGRAPVAPLAEDAAAQVTLPAELGAAPAAASRDDRAARRRLTTLGAVTYGFAVAEAPACAAHERRFLDSVAFEPGWTPYVDGEGRYSVAIPEPAARVVRRSIAGLRGEVFFPGDRLSLGVACVSVSQTVDEPLHRDMMAKAAAGLGGALERLDPEDGPDAPGFEGTVNGADWTARLRSRRLGKRVCHAFVLGPKDAPVEGAVATRFLDAFQMLDAR